MQRPLSECQHSPSDTLHSDDGDYYQSFTWSFTWLVTPTMTMIVDDHAAHQTLAVSIKKPISMARTFCKDALIEFTEVASSALAGRLLFHLFTTVSEKK